MKKRKSLLVLVCLIILVSVLTACNKQDAKQLDKYISYSHNASYVGEDGDYTVIIEAGNKEEIFVDDGKVGKIVPFFSIIVIPKKADENSSLDIKIYIDNQETAINLTKDMFTGNFEKNISEKGVASKVMIGKNAIELKNKMAECIDKATLMKIINDEFSEQIAAGWKDNVFSKELYIKLIRDNNNINGQHYWYVALIDGQNSFCSMLVDAKTGKVLSKKTT